MIWNRAIFAEAGLDPENPPATWNDVVAYSKQIKDNTGKDGYGMVARVNAGNTPFRGMPRSGPTAAAPSTRPSRTRPTKRSSWTTTASRPRCSSSTTCMSATSRCRPSALTNTQTENRDPFVAGQLAMMISHPSEYAAMLDTASKATGDDKASPTTSSPIWPTA